MKLLFVLDQYGAENNGVTVSAMRYARVLEQRGNEVRFLSTGTAHKGYSVRELRIPVFDSLIKSHGMIFGKPEKAVLREALAWADQVHFLMPFSLSIGCAKMARKMGKPATAAFHVQPQNITYSIGMGKWTVSNSFIYWLFRADFYHQFRHIHCPSAFIAGQLERHGYRASLHVISNGISPEFVPHKTAKPPEWQDRTVVLMIGRLSGEKRQDVLIDAVKRCRHASEIQLVLAGQGPKRNAYLRQSQGLAHPIHMEFYPQEKLRELLGCTDLYVHTSDAEIEAMSCMEAFASGRVPVIADSPLSATPQFALDDRSLFRPGDAGDLAEKIDWWLDHPAEKAEMEAKYAASAQRYRLDECVTRFEEMLREARETGSWR